MKTLISLIICLVCGSAPAQAAITETHFYLKIKLDDQQEISYPPGTRFVVQDASGNAVLSPSQLEEVKEYTIIEPITLWVFTSWNEEPDTYELTSGTLSMEVSDYKGSIPYDFGRFKKRKDAGQHDTRDMVYSKRGSSQGVYMFKERFFDYDATTGYDASFEFNNDVIFYYRDGKAEAWQNGKRLNIEGKYRINTTLGVLKLSYDPQNKEIWYVFEKNM